MGTLLPSKVCMCTCTRVAAHGEAGGSRANCLCLWGRRAGLEDPRLMGLFDYHMTYRMDSHVVTMYAPFDIRWVCTWVQGWGGVGGGGGGGGAGGGGGGVPLDSGIAWSSWPAGANRLAKAAPTGCLTD